MKENNVFRSKDLTVKVEELEAKVEALCEKIENKNNEIIYSQGETRNLQEEMTVVNKVSTYYVF